MSEFSVLTCTLWGRKCLGQNNMNNKPPEMKMNKWHPVGAQAPSRSPPTQEEFVLPGMRLRTASGAYFKTLPEKVSPDSCHGDKQLSLPFEPEGSQTESMSNLTSWRKRLSLTVAQAPEGHLHIWRKTCPEGRPWATPRLPRASSLLSVSPLLLPKLSESAGRPGSWAVFPAAPL